VPAKKQTNKQTTTTTKKTKKKEKKGVGAPLLGLAKSIY